MSIHVCEVAEDGICEPVLISSVEDGRPAERVECDYCGREMPREAWSATTVALTDGELAYFRSGIRMHYRKTLRGRATAATKWGDEFDPTAHDSRMEFLVTLYKKITPGAKGSTFLREVLADTEDPENFG